MAVLYYVFCPEEVRLYRNRFDYVSGTSGIISDAQFGVMRGKLAIKDRLSEVDVKYRYYDMLVGSQYYIRLGIQGILILAFLPLFLGNVFNAVFYLVR